MRKSKKEETVSIKITKSLAYKLLDSITHVELAKEFRRLIEGKPDLTKVIKELGPKNKQMVQWATAKRRELVSKQTQAEKVFKARLKACGLDYKFQEIIYTSTSFYIADFVFPTKKIVLELDGGYHTDPVQKSKDKLRTQELNFLGYKVIRLTNEKSYTISEAEIKKFFG
jgi:very-short-patch-repair endonuclease